MLDGRLRVTFTRGLDETVRMAGLTAEVALYESTYFYAFAVTDLPKLKGSGGNCSAEVFKYDPSEQDEQLQATLARLGREETPSMANIGSLFADRIALEMRVALFLIATVAVTFFAVNLVDLSRIALWAIESQRGFQNQMAGAIRALKAGEVGAYTALLSATAAYGFVHALGPGHGKYLVGGVGIGTSVSVRKLVGLATVSSLAQSLWAIVLVFGGFSLVELSARQMTVMAEEYLAPISYLAIAGIGTSSCLARD